MKKWLYLCVCLVMMIGVGGCGSTTEPMTETNQTITTEEITAENEENVDKSFEVRIGDIIDTIGNEERYFVYVHNTTEKYVNSLVELTLFNAEGKELCKKPVFFMNATPDEKETIFMTIPIGETIDSYDLNVIRFSASDKPEKTPEITKDNVYQYLYFTYTPMGKVDYGEATLVGDLCNLTTQYFSGSVNYRVKNEHGEIVMDTVKTYSNIEPGWEDPYVDGATPSKEYHVEYEILDFQFTDEPI